MMAAQPLQSIQNLGDFKQFIPHLNGHFFEELTVRTRTIVSGLEVTLVTPATVSLPTTAPSSPPWIGITTWPPSVAPVPPHMAGAGGSTGDRLKPNGTQSAVDNFSCFEANLNGEYFPIDADNGYYRGIIWELWLGDNSLKAASMMIRTSHTGPTPVI